MADRMGNGVIFDFNGTMIFDAAVNREAWRILLQRIIGRDCTEEEFFTQIQGVNGRESVAWFAEREGLDATPGQIEEWGVEADAIYRRVLVERTGLFKFAPGLEAFLDELRSRGVALNIASAAPPANMELFFEHLGLDRWFDYDLVAMNDGSIPGKPAPDIYLLAAERIGVSPSSCTVFEDAKSGIEAARRAGVGAIVGVMSQLSEGEMRAIPGVTRAIPDYRDAGKLAALVQSVASE